MAFGYFSDVFNSNCFLGSGSQKNIAQQATRTFIAYIHCRV
jgi:hypothetical protein